MTASLIQPSDPSYFSAVITSPAQIPIFPVPETKIQSMISDSLVRDTPKQQSAKNKGPPPPVPKKPSNPFGKEVTHAIHKPRPYSDLLQKNIKMGRRESALHYVTEDFDKSLPDLDRSICPGSLDSPSYMCIKGDFDPSFQHVDFPAIYSDLDDDDKDLWTKIVDILPEPEGMDISQIKHILEKKAKIKGPPPPVPEKPLNPFVAIERHAALPINVSISKKTAGNLTYERCDYKPYMCRTVHKGELEPIFATDRVNSLVTYSNSNTLDENVFLRFRPDLIGESDNVYEKRTKQSSRANAGNQNKVLEMTKTFDVKKPFSCQIERRLSPKKGESIL